MGERRPQIVVKLGGSYAGSPHLRDWLDAIVCGVGQLVLAPGGGLFAELVREMQPIMGFDDQTAHHMALRAMDQYAMALASLDERLRLADTKSGIERALINGKVAVWSPTKMAGAARKIPQSWHVTSDSLAVWLAARIGARRLVLVKHVEVAADQVDASALAAAGVVDPAFLHFLGPSGIEASVAAPHDYAAAAAAFARGELVGRRIGVK